MAHQAGCWAVLYIFARMAVCAGAKKDPGPSAGLVGSRIDPTSGIERLRTGDEVMRQPRLHVHHIHPGERVTERAAIYWKTRKVVAVGEQGHGPVEHREREETSQHMKENAEVQ